MGGKPKFVMTGMITKAGTRRQDTRYSASNVPCGYEVLRPSVSPRQAALRRLFRNRLVLLGCCVALFLLLLALFGPMLAPKDPVHVDVYSAFSPPGPGFPLGTDQLGRDMLSRLMHGARPSLLIAVTSIACGMLIGTILGLVSGYAGGILDLAVGRVMDLFFSVPLLLLAIVIAGVLGSTTRNTILALTIVFVPSFYRMTRGPVLRELNNEFVLAARVVGARPARIIFRHLLPNVIPVVLINMSLSISSAILIEASLSFLGLGTQPPNPSWGRMLAEGRVFLERAPWESVFPGLAIMLAVLSCNLVGDGLRDAFDPRMT